MQLLSEVSPVRPAHSSPAVRRPVGPYVRSVQPGDDAAIRQLFRDTVCLGRPLPFEVPEFDAYESLCLDWYLGTGRQDAGVLVDDTGIAGYALVCTDAADYGRWQRTHATAFSGLAARKLMSRRICPDASKFLRLRLKDGWDMWRNGVVPPLPAHAHMNLASRSRAVRMGYLLALHIDDRCRLAGLPGWFGEMNALSGRRSRALERLGGTVVHRAPNHTLSWLMGQPVERLTVARWLPAADTPRVTSVPAGAEIGAGASAVAGRNVADADVAYAEAAVVA
jgi:hypothetical protein